jgi:ferrous iron transport protein B
MVFCLLYSPCLATISVLNKEIGKKWTLISCSIQFVVAYLCSLFVFAIGTTIEKGGINLLLIALSFAIILGLSLKFAFKIFSKKGKCIGCKKCK